MNIISGHYPSEHGSCEPYVTVELGCPWFRDDITYWCPTCGLHSMEHPWSDQDTIDAEAELD